MSNEKSNNAQNYSDATAPAEQAGRKLQLVRAGSSLFGVFADEIATIAAWRKPTPLPHAAKSVLGVVSVQGRLLTVLDLASLPGAEASSQNDAPGDAPNNTPNNVPNNAPKVAGDAPGSLVALRGDEQLALAVDEVGESIALDESSFNAQPENPGKLVLGVLQRAGAQIKILNLKELFPTAIQGRERRRRRF